MSTSQHFKKRKSRTSNAPARRPFASLETSVDASTDDDATMQLTKLHVPHAQTQTHAPPLNESATLAAALTALQLSLKRDLESFTPPTPAASPVHANRSKRARFDFPGVELDGDDCAVPVATTAPTKVLSPAPKARGAMLAVSTRIKFELDTRLRKNSERMSHQRSSRKRKQLSYFAILGAFHQAAHERACSAAATSATEGVGPAPTWTTTTWADRR